MISVYQPLADFLTRRKGDRWDASFTDIETALGRSLPQSAYRHQAWWANQSGAGHSQTHGWRSAGWRTARLDLAHRRVTFERERRTPSPGAAADTLSDAMTTLFDTASSLTGITDRDVLIVAGMRALIAHHTACALDDLGGSMPDYCAPERERP